MRLDTPEKRLAARHVPPDFRELRYDSLSAVIYAKQDGTGRVHAKAYHGTAYHHSWNYSFRTAESFEGYATEWLHGLEQSKAFKAQQQSKRTGVCPWKVGQTLVCSWGYDQTNIDYYEVIAVRGQVVDIQEIGQHFIDQQGPSGDTVIPFRGHRGKIIKSKRPQTHDNGKTWSLHMTSYAWAHPWDGKPDHQTDPSFGH
jgi:hypothetical protein